MILLMVILVLLSLLLLLIIFYYYYNYSSTQNKNKDEYRLLADYNTENDDIGNSLTNYLQSYEKNNNMDSLFKVVRIYRFGNNNGTLQDFSKARYILQYIIENGTDVQRETAKMILNELQDEEQVHYKNKELERRRNNIKNRHRHNKMVNEMLNNSLQGLLILQNDVLLENDILPPEVLQGYNKDLENKLLNSLKFKNRTTRVNTPPPLIEPPPRIIEEIPPEVVVEFDQKDNDRIINDPQNVHDSTVIRGIKDALLKIDTTKLPTNWNNELRNAVLSSNNTKAFNNLHTMLSDPQNITSFDTNSQNILKAVWARINDPINADIKNDMKDILINQLSDGDGYCMVGKCVRVMQTLEATDKGNSVNIKPEWALNEEINSNASVLYKDMYNTLDENDKKKIDNIESSVEDQNFINNFKNNYKVKLQENLNKNYPHLMNKSLIEAKVNEIADNVI